MNSINPKRSLGQNFFSNKNLAKKIVTIVTETTPPSILEIGPGTGVFTHLLSKNTPVVAIEKDDYLYNLLQGYTMDRDIQLIHSDVRSLTKTNLSDLIKDRSSVIFGSLPYNQSKQIISKILSVNLVSDHYYIIQKEVAQKYVSINKMNRLTATSRIFGESSIRVHIKPENFKPKPKVNSALIHFKSHEIPLIPEDLYQKYLGFVNLVFKNPRKKLKNNLNINEPIPNLDESLLLKRAENLSLEELISIFHAFTNTSE